MFFEIRSQIILDGFLVFLDILGIFLLAHLTEELLKIVLNTAFSLRFLDLMLIPLDQTPKMNHRT